MVLLFGSFVVLLLIGVPVLFTLGISSLFYIFTTHTPLSVVPRSMVDSLNSFVYLALPLFMLSGEIMSSGGITRRLIGFAKVFIGRIRGGLAYVNVIACLLFASVQGLATSDTAAIGRIMIPAMKKEGYDPAFAAALTASAATVGGLFPPSLLLIIYGVTTGTSIGALFLGAVIPGILIAAAHMLYIFCLAVIKGEAVMPRTTKLDFPAVRANVLSGIPTMLIPLTILGGILGGMFTPTEAAGIACVVAVLLSLVYREMKARELPGTLLRAGKLSGGVMLIMGTSYVFAYILTAERIPTQLTEALLLISDNVFVILIIVNIFLLAVGTFMDPTPAVIVLGPILAPALVGMGLDPVHVGIIISYNLIIGLITPPSAVCLFVVTSISGESLERVSWAVVPLMLVNIAVLFVITYFPQTVTWLPRLAGL
jgi:tripartite ATP-independent transporter DctM subunit